MLKVKQKKQNILHYLKHFKSFLTYKHRLQKVFLKSPVKAADTYTVKFRAFTTQPEVFMKLKRQLFPYIACLVLAGFVFPCGAETFFSGYAGAKSDIYSNPAATDDDFDTQLQVQAYFAGQLNMTRSFLVRGEFSVQTEDIFSSGVFNDTEAVFCINEVSATYIKPFLGNTQYISAFFGTFEPIGSDVFLQRQFGMQPITSLLTESWLGLRGSYIYPFYGAGASYVIHFDRQPIASGFYLYKNHADNDENDDQINLDWRFATSKSWLTFDFATGIGMPLSRTYNNDDVILLINTVYLHTGLELLLGNRYRQSLFLQAGFEQVPLKSSDDKNELKDSEVYLLFEPRFTAKDCKIHLTFFNFPESLVEAGSHENVDTRKLIFIEDSLGLNLAIFTDNLYVKNKNISFGLHTTLSLPDRYLFDLNIKSLDELKSLLGTDTDDAGDDFNVKISPFLSLPVMTGTLHMMFQANITDIKDDGWQKAVKLNIGYKSQL